LDVRKMKNIHLRVLNLEKRMTKIRSTLHQSSISGLLLGLALERLGMKSMD
jgi:hypothetical protein